jgi:hypothetical protein
MLELNKCEIEVLEKARKEMVLYWYDAGAGNDVCLLFNNISIDELLKRSKIARTVLEKYRNRDKINETNNLS